VWVSWFSLKTKVDVSPGSASKPVAMILVVLPQNHSHRFPSFHLGDLTHKITMTVSWFGPQNQLGGGLLLCASKPMSG
jgi:hypothetical protein